MPQQQQENVLHTSYQLVIIWAFTKPPFSRLGLEKENLHTRHQMSQGGDSVSFTAQLGEGRVLALL